MAVPDPQIKASVRHNGHRPLVQRAERYVADEVRRQNPQLNEARVIARATRDLAAALGVARVTLVRMRQDGYVPPKHWWGFERATNGHVKAADFEQATHE